MRMKKLLRISSVLVILGLAAEIASIFWFHPLAFVLFVFVAGGLTVIGIVIFLASLVFVARPEQGRSGGERMDV